MDDSPSTQLPLGFVSALAANSEAMQSFSQLTQEQQKAVVDSARKLRSKLEMRNYVNQIAEGGML